jgi:hypothetical protein
MIRWHFPIGKIDKRHSRQGIPSLRFGVGKRDQWVAMTVLQWGCRHRKILGTVLGSRSPFRKPSVNPNPRKLDRGLPIPHVLSRCLVSHCTCLYSSIFPLSFRRLLSIHPISLFVFRVCLPTGASEINFGLENRARIPHTSCIK